MTPTRRIDATANIDTMIEFLLPLHVMSAVLSLLLFSWRGVMMWCERPLKNRLWCRIVPDSVDTLLLGSAILMVFLLDISPLDSAWLAAKIVALLVYIILGAVALKYGCRLWLKRGCFIAALCVFAYIVAVARSSNPLPWS